MTLRTHLITVHLNSTVKIALANTGAADAQLNSTQVKSSRFSRTSWSGVLQFDQSTTIPFRPPFTPNTLPLDRWRSYAGPSLGSGEGAAMSIELQLAEGA